MKTNKKCKNGHTLNWNECGYGGGKYADVFCDKCKKFILVPVDIYKARVPYLYDLWLTYNAGQK